MAYDSVNPQVSASEQGLTTADLSERRAGVDEEPYTFPPEVTPQEDER